jgi:peroxiredoxin/protein-disulfide isomerase
MKVLLPGIKAPDFELPTANSDQETSLKAKSGKNLVLVFFPPGSKNELLDQLANYQTRLPVFKEQGAIVIGISDATSDELRKLSEEREIGFVLASDSNPPAATANRYGISTKNQTVLPTVFIVDEQGLIRRAYESSQYPHLPNPAMIVRALKNLANVPKSPPVTREDWQLGPAKAPVTVLEYADYQCKPCGEAYRLLKQIIPSYGGRILWVHRHLPLRHSHPLAQQSAEAAEAAGAQGKFWEMHDRLFEARLALEREQLIEYAGEIGLDVAKFTEDLDSRRFSDAVNADFKQAVKNKIKLPPALFINGLFLEGPRTETAIRSQIDNLLACITE